MFTPESVISENDEGRSACRSRIVRGAEPLGPRHEDEVLLQRRDHVRAQQLPVHRGFGDHQRQARQDDRCSGCRAGPRGTACSRWPAGCWRSRRRTARSAPCRTRTAAWPRRRTRSSSTPGRRAGRAGRPSRPRAARRCSSASSCATIASSNDTGIRSASACGHRLAGAEGAAEVTGDHAAEPVDVAHQQRPVELQRLADLLHLLGRGVVARDDDGGVAGQQVHHDERQERHGEQDEHEVGQALPDAAQPGPSPAAARRAGPRSRRRAGRS